MTALLHLVIDGIDVLDPARDPTPDAVFRENILDHGADPACQAAVQALEGGEVEITGSFPAGTIGTTSENLAAAAGGEHYETNVMYPEFAKTAREEGFEEIAKIFLAIAVAEKQHEKVFLALKANVDQGTVFAVDRKSVV